MLCQLILTLPLLSQSLIVAATPLKQREAAPLIIEHLLNGILTPITQLISDILTGTKSAIDDTRSSKPLTCSLSLLNTDKCCACKSSIRVKIRLADHSRVRCLCRTDKTVCAIRRPMQRQCSCRSPHGIPRCRFLGQDFHKRRRRRFPTDGLWRDQSC